MLALTTILLPLSLALLVRVVRARFLPDAPRRLSILVGACAWAVALVIITEGLTLFRSLDRISLIVAWSVALIGLVILNVRSRVPARWLPRIRRCAPGVLIVPAGCIAVALLAIALVAPPNNVDSLTYHMARVVHWIQNHGVQHYPTHIPRQINMPPAAEYIILHLQLLSGGDRFASVVQWSAMLGSLIAVSLIAKRLGAGRWGQALAIVFCVTIPMGIAQATSTQNDWVEAFWMSSFTAIMFEILAQPNRRILIVAAGASLGMALLTKGTGYVFAPTFCALLAIGYLLQRRAGVSLRWILLRLTTVAVIALALSATHFVRNARDAGSVLGPMREEETGYTNGHFGGRVMLSNLIRDLSLEIAAPDGPRFTGIKGFDDWLEPHLPRWWETPPDQRWEKRVENAVRAMHTWFGADPDDPQTIMGATRYYVAAAWNHEDTAENPLHLLLIVCAMLSLPWKRWRGKRAAICYSAALVGSLLLFCFVLRWQPWHNRLLMPLIVLGSPIVAVAMSRIWNRFVASIIAILLLVAAIPSVLNNQSRPMLGERSVFTVDRSDQYFTMRPGVRPDFERCAKQLHDAKCSRVGLIMGNDDAEYLLWILTRPAENGMRFDHVRVKNYSAACADPTGDESTETIDAVVTIAGSAATVGRR